MLKKGLFLLIFFFSWVAIAHAGNEKILDFVSNITVNKDASLDVIEVITVKTNEDKILHGIVRRLPTRYKDSYGISHHTKYFIKDILMNNLHSAYHAERYRSHYNIYIGKIDEMLPAGVYTYTIHYRVNQAINFLKETDELYWNVTGNDWDFPILKAQANITLPEGSKILQYSAYTGKQGDKEKNYSVKQPNDRQIIFDLTQPLPTDQGLTVAVAWPTGIIVRPTIMQRLQETMKLEKGEYLVLEIFFIVLGYFLVIWYMHGRDPRKNSIIPTYTPPKNISPAAMRYIYRMGYDIKTFTAALVSMATEKFITIKNQNDVFTLIKQNSDENQLSPDEHVLAKTLFTNANSIELRSSNQEKINHAQQQLKNVLAKENQGRYFVNNTVYLLPGFILSLLAFLAAILAADDKSAAFFAVGWCTIWTFVCLLLVLQAWSDVQRTITYFTVNHLIRSIFSLIFAIPFLIGEVVGIYLFTDTIPIFTTPFLFSIVLLNIVFYYLFKRPTVQGQKLREQIEGFKLFLSKYEQNRLNKLNPPKKSLDLFERYLPYAIALDVENAWGEQFNEMLQEAATKDDHYQPHWYTGTPWNNSALSNFPAYLDTSLNSALATTSSISTSSSSSGGSGSSGGGTGGGGGGGW